MKKQTSVVVLLVLGLILLLFPEVCPAPADAVGDASLLVGQGSAEHTVHGAPVAHLQAAAQPAFVLLQQQRILIVVGLLPMWLPTRAHIPMVYCNSCYAILTPPGGRDKVLPMWLPKRAHIPFFFKWCIPVHCMPF